MRRKALKGSVTVEAALICPFVLLVVIAFLELGLSLVLDLRARAVLEQTELVYSSLRDEGATVEESQRKALSFMNESLGNISLKCEKIYLTVSDNWLEESLRMEATLVLPVGFSPELTVKKTATYLDARKVRDILSVLSEDSRKIPGADQLWNKYEEYIKRWAETLK